MLDAKEDFPLLRNDPTLVYLDSAATTQKPQAVIDSLVEFYSQYNANVHRGIYQLSETATELYEQAREKVAQFIGASKQEIIFNSGTTAGMNFLARSLARKDDATLLSVEQHHSALLPWQQVTKNVDYVGLTDSLELDYQDLEQKLTTKKFKFLILTHVSNVTGAVLDLEKVKQIIDGLDYAPIVVLDAAQSVGHLPINVRALPIDFLVASAHKVYGPTGLGFVWGKDRLLAKLEPSNWGGGMVGKVERQQSSWDESPQRFEAGTPPIAQAVGFVAAIDYLQDLGWDTIVKHEQELVSYAREKMQQIESLNLHIAADSFTGILTFTSPLIHAHDLAQLLADKNATEAGLQVAVRAGHHCTQLFHREIIDEPASVRASLGIYNNKHDIDHLVEKIAKSLEFFADASKA